MMSVGFDRDVLVVRPDGPIDQEDVVMLERAADAYLAVHPTLSGVMVHTPEFPGFASATAFAHHMHFIANHHARVRRIALVTDSPLAPIAQFMANHVMGLEMRHYAFGESAAALEWLRAR